MKLTTLYRNRLTTFIIGKYNLDKIANRMLLEDEEYISSVDILFYNGLMIILAFLLSILTLFLLAFSKIFLIYFLFPFFLLYYGIEVELIILTSERVIIEKRGLVEKILRVKNIRSVSIDQIAIFSYARAPFNYAALSTVLIVGLFLFEIIDTPINISNLGAPYVLILFLRLFILGFLLYLTWYGFRLSKRSIELSIIGLTKPILIGTRKGAPQWFVNDMEMIIYDRIHHIFHSQEITEIKIEENPLEYDSNLRELLLQTEKPLQRKILELLTTDSLSKRQILSLLPSYTKIEIDEAMRQLRKIQFVFYDRGLRMWCINKKYIIHQNKNIELDQSLIAKIFPNQDGDFNIMMAIELVGIEWAIQQVGLKKVIDELGLTKVIQEVDIYQIIEQGEISEQL